MTPNEALVCRFFDDIWNQQRLDLAGELVSDDYTVHLVGNTSELRGPEVVRRGVQSFRSGFPDWTDTIEDIFSAGDRVAVRWRSSGTHTGLFAGVAPSGRTLHLSGIDLFRIEGGRIAEHWSQADISGFIERVKETAG